MNKMSDARQWTIATVLIVVVILAAAYFLLISPTLAGASEANAAAEAQEEMNANTQIEVNKLKAQFEDIETYQAQLEELQQGITTSQRYADLQRLFAAVAANHNVVITRLQFGSARPLEVKPPRASGDDAAAADPAVDPAQAPATSDGLEDESAANGTVGAAPAPSVPGLYSISVNLTLTGDYNDVLNAVRELQSGTTRLVLITSVTLSSLGGSAPGGEEVDSGLVTATLAGETFVLADQNAIANEEGTEEEGAEPTPVPLPQSTDNPLTPPKR